MTEKTPWWTCLDCYAVTVRPTKPRLCPGSAHVLQLPGEGPRRHPPVRGFLPHGKSAKRDRGPNFLVAPGACRRCDADMVSQDFVGDYSIPVATCIDPACGWTWWFKDSVIAAAGIAPRKRSGRNSAPSPPSTVDSSSGRTQGTSAGGGGGGPADPSVIRALDTGGA